MFCLLYLILLLTTPTYCFEETLSQPHFPGYCSRPTSVTEGSYSFLQEDVRGVGHTATVRLALRETTCYKVRLRIGEELQDRLYVVEYLGAEHHFPIKSGYNFSVPVISSECSCSCPNEDKLKCEAALSRDPECGSGSSTSCRVVRESGQTPEGCVWVSGEAASCCLVKISSHPPSQATAVQLSAHQTRLIVAVTVLDLTNRTVIREREKLPLVNSRKGTSLSLDEHFRITTSLQGSGYQIISPDQYIIYNGEVSKLIGSTPNGLNDWDFNRLGWYKQDQDGTFNFKEGTLQNLIKIRTYNCGKSKMKLDVNGRFYRDGMLEDFILQDGIVPLTQYYASDIKSVRVSDDHRSVIVSPLNTPRITLDFQHFELNQTVEELTQVDSTGWLSDPPLLGDFSADISQDEWGNNMLTITFYEAVGDIVGYVTPPDPSEFVEDLTVYVPIGGSTVYSQYTIKLTTRTKCSRKSKVCLKPANFKFKEDTSLIKCRLPTCTYHTHGRIPAPTPHLHHTLLPDRSVMRWGRFANPAYLFDGDFQYMELVGVLLYLLVGGVLVAVGYKIHTCWRKKEVKHATFTDPDTVFMKPGSGTTTGRKLERMMSEGLEEFETVRKVGWSRSQEDILCDGSRVEDWARPRRYDSL